MNINSVIPFPGSAAAHQAQAAQAAAVAAAHEIRPLQAPSSRADDCESCNKVDSRSRALLDPRSQLLAQEAAGEARHMERVAAQSASGGASQESELSDEERRQVTELKKADAAVRRHEQAHANTGGQYAGAVHLDFTTGPDGKRYATAGHVPIDVTPVANDPKATLRKMDQVQRAALAPADPSPEDRAVAAKAAQEKTRAQQELTKQATQPADADGGTSGAGDPASQTASAAAGGLAAGSETPSGRRAPQTIDIGSLFGITA